MWWNLLGSRIKDQASSENYYSGSMPVPPPKTQAHISLFLEQRNFLARSCNYIIQYGSGNTRELENTTNFGICKCNFGGANNRKSVPKLDQK